MGQKNHGEKPSKGKDSAVVKQPSGKNESKTSGIEQLLYDNPIANHPVNSIGLALVLFVSLIFLRSIRKKQDAFVEYIKQSSPLKIVYLPEYEKFAKKRKGLRENFSPLGRDHEYLFGRFGITRHEPLHFFGYKTDKHLLTIAPNRTGKGRGLILPNLLSLPEHSVFVIDPKGENALVSAKYRQDQGHEVVIFNPHGIFADQFKALGFAQFQSFNPLANLDPASPNFSADITTLAEAVIYQTGGDSHWTESAQGLVEFLIMYLVTEPTETPSFRRLRSILAKGYEGIKEIRVRCAASEFPQVQDTIERYAIETNEVHSVIATAETQTRLFKNEVVCAALDGGAFSFERMKNKKVSVYLILPTEYLITEARYLRLVLLVAMSQFMRSEKGKHQVLCMLDEFANLGALKIIENGYGIIAGHGVTLWSFVQNLTQLQNLYPKNWEVFIANAAVVTVANVNDVTTAEYFSKRAGKKLVERTSHSQGGSLATTNTGTNTSQLWEDALPVSELYQAHPDRIFLVMEGKNEPVRASKIFYDLDEPFRSRAGRNPMHKPSGLSSSGSYEQKRVARDYALWERAQNAVFAEDGFRALRGDQKGKVSGSAGKGFRLFRPFFWTVEMGKFVGSLAAIMISVTGILYFGATALDNFIDKNGNSDLVKATKLNEVAGHDQLSAWVDKNIAVPLGNNEEKLSMGMAPGRTAERWRRVDQALDKERIEQEKKKAQEKAEIHEYTEKMRKFCASGKPMMLMYFGTLINCYNVSQNHECHDQRFDDLVVKGIPPTEKTPKDSCHVTYRDGSIVEGDIILLYLAPEGTTKEQYPHFLR